MGSKSPQRGLHHSFPLSASSLSDSGVSPQLFSQFHPGESSLSGNNSSSREGGHRACPPFSRLLQQGICRHEGLRGLEADYRPVGLESPCGVHQVPHGDSSISSPNGATRRLDDLGRPQGCLSSGSYESGISSLLEVRSFRPSLPVSGSLFWTEDVPASFYSGDGSSISNFAFDGHKNAQVPQRLVGPSVESGGLSLGRDKLLYLCKELGIRVNLENPSPFLHRLRRIWV